MCDISDHKLVNTFGFKTLHIMYICFKLKTLQHKTNIYNKLILKLLKDIHMIRR